MRFDIYWAATGPVMEPHFCREWDDEGGCYGTRDDHGLSLNQASDAIAEWHDEQSKLWRARAHPTALYYLETQQKDNSHV